MKPRLHAKPPPTTNGSDPRHSHRPPLRHPHPTYSIHKTQELQMPVTGLRTLRTLHILFINEVCQLARRPRHQNAGASICHTPTLVTNDDFILADGDTCHPYVPDHRAPRTVFDDFEPAFMVIEYLSSSQAIAEYLSDVFRALELIVVARHLEYRTCHNQE